MKQQCRETTQRAIGIIEGVAFVSDGELRNALNCAASMLMCVLEAEEVAEEGADNEQHTN